VNEADRKRSLVAEVKHLGGYARRVEDRWAVGVLDLIIKLPGHELFMAEGKLIKGNLFAPTATQYAEGVKWIKAGVDVVLIGWQDKAMYISPWVKQADKRDCWQLDECGYAESLSVYMKENQAPHAKDQNSLRN
jgi:hypothetical protein